MSVENGDGPRGSVGSGQASSAEARLSKLLTEHRQIVSALEISLKLLQGHARAKKTMRQSSVIDQALALEGMRGALKKQRGRPRKHPVGSPKTHPPGYNSPKTVLARRQKSIELLALFDKTPKTTKEVGLSDSDARWLSSLARYGYLKRKSPKHGWVRTALEFSEKPGWNTTGA